ncbi:MAG TPA: alpha/beta fold hydrolase [Solirubrobacterales bacterium]|nr:alpha/beta fold hydrolase [Solirubrobacterales bacterium]
MPTTDRPTPSRALSRRGLLAGAAAAGAAASLARVPFAGAAEPGDATKTRKLPSSTFFQEEALNFEMLFVVGAAGYGAAEPGEVLAAFDRIKGKKERLSAVYDEFLRLGRQARRRGDEDRKSGRFSSARSNYLRSAMYLDQSLFYVLATNEPTRGHEGRAYSEMEASWARAMALLEPAGQAVRIPFEGYHLPGWLLTPGGKGRRPTVIINNGSDAQNVDVYVEGGAAALERGWNALIFEGPGQGSNLFLHNRPFVPDWERVITPVVDFLRARPEVDKRRICLTGSSFGGYLTPRAAAFEHRLAGLVADPGVVDAFYSWRTALPKEVLEVFEAGDRNVFNRIWKSIPGRLGKNEKFSFLKRAEIYGNGGGFEKMTLASKFHLTPEVAAKIEAPTAICSPELEQFFPGQSEQLLKLVRTPKKLLRFTVEEGAEWHCEPMAPQLRNERVFDWLEANMRPVG